MIDDLVVRNEALAAKHEEQQHMIDALQDEGADTVEANEKLGFAVDAREYLQCAEILFDLGLCKVRVISNNPDKLKALQDAGLQIVERIPIEVPAEEPAAHYLKTKKEKMGHLIGS